jgi:hypothetical protein
MNAQREFQRLSQNPQQRESTVPAVSNGRKLIRDEIERYLEGLVAAKVRSYFFSIEFILSSNAASLSRICSKERGLVGDISCISW